MEEYEKLRAEIDQALGESPGRAGAEPAARPAADGSERTPAHRFAVPTTTVAVAGGVAALVFVVCAILPFVSALGPAVGAFIGALLAGWLVPRLSR